MPFPVESRGSTDPSRHARAASENCGALKVNVAVGNHRCWQGIGEILYTLKAFFSRLSSSYEVRYSIDVEPGVTNVLIDEFSLVKTIDALGKFKKAHPSTKFVIVATEFITPVRLFGLQLAETFNYFDPWEDRKYLFETIAQGLGLSRLPPYMRARYLGFSQALRLADFVIAVHPAIVEALLPLGAEMDHWLAAPTNLYPEISSEQSAMNVLLRGRPAGFVTTGTRTRFRRKVVKKLLQTSRGIAAQGEVFEYLPIDHSDPFVLHDGSIEFPFERAGDEGGGEKRLDAVSVKMGGLYNLNPPQRANWPYSSPMRILRAVLYGQVPVVTHRFGDHEIEALAKLWNPDVPGSRVIMDLWREATFERESLVERHLAGVSQYNEIAKEKNAAVDRAFRSLSPLPR
jgi:hypothetical protein